MMNGLNQLINQKWAAGHNKYAIVSFPPDTQLKIIVVESSAAAAAFRSQFESMWQKAVPLNKHPLNAITIDQKLKKRVK